MAAALQTLSWLAKGGRAVAILGDMLELGPDEAREHRSLGELAAQTAQLIAFFGPRSAEAHRAAAGRSGIASHFEQLDDLLRWLRPRLVKGDVVLVKGSRGMRLERAVEALCGSANAGEIHA
jgi:UDP-N-acetylmuramoyl-tripeptide--D-alanyl-D-alanine ligase